MLGSLIKVSVLKLSLRNQASGWSFPGKSIINGRVQTVGVTMLVFGQAGAIIRILLFVPAIFWKTRARNLKRQFKCGYSFPRQNNIIYCERFWSLAGSTKLESLLIKLVIKHFYMRIIPKMLVYIKYRLVFCIVPIQCWRAIVTWIWIRQNIEPSWYVYY